MKLQNRPSNSFADQMKLLRPDGTGPSAVMQRMMRRAGRKPGGMERQKSRRKSPA